MAATGKTPILLYGSTTATNQPSAGNLTNSSDGCEIAINVADKNLFFKDSTNTVNTVPVRQSSASSDGWLSSTDWSTFNSKQPAGTYVTSVTGTAPVVSSGGTTPAISMAAANGSTNGYLTSTDWTTFNSKQPSGSYAVTNAGQTFSGTQAFSDITASSSIALTNSNNGAAQISISNTNSGSSAMSRFLAISDGGNVQVKAMSTTNTTYGAADCGVINCDNMSNGLRIAHDDVVRMVVAYAGDVTVSTGNLVIGTSGKGIDFSATPQPSGMTSELLADYEEGTWTPTIIGSSTNPTYTTSYAAGIYTKIGRIVYVEFLIIVTGVTSQGTGGIGIESLPFDPGASWSVTSYAANVNIVYNDIWDVNVRNGYARSGSKIYFAQNAVTQSDYTYAGATLSTGYFSGSGFYTI